MKPMILIVKVSPGAKKTIHQILIDGTVKLFLKAIPQKGQANKELIDCLSKLLQVPILDIEIIGGANCKIKRIKILNKEPDYIYEKLGMLGLQLKI